MYETAPRQRTMDFMIKKLASGTSLQFVAAHSQRLETISGRALLVGCDVATIEFLCGPQFDLNLFAVDRDMADIEACKLAVAHIAGMQNRLSFLADDSLPFDDDYFSAIVWAEGQKLGSADSLSRENTFAEFQRVIRAGGTTLVAVDFDPTSQTVEGWAEELDADRVEYDRRSQQLAIWKRARIVDSPAATTHDDDVSLEHHPAESKDLYQSIYDENPWYGNAEEDRCPGVRLLPDYQDWLVGPVLDLGCGRGHVVEALIEAGFEAEGIDQIVCNPKMRVGDITKPIADIQNFKSAVCVDCIEHLYEEQVTGLFENMKQTQRQAFSIHNGESTGTGQELHVNRKDFIDWTKIIREYFDIASAIQIHENQVLYLTRTRETS